MGKGLPGQVKDYFKSLKEVRYQPSLNTTQDEPVVLGIHLGHDASAALIKGGRILAAIEEERLTRLKGFAGFPYGAIEEILCIARMTPGDIKVVAIAGEHLHRELMYWVLLKRIRRLSRWKEVYSKVLMGLTYVFASNWLRQLLYPAEVFWRSVHQELTNLGFGKADFKSYDHHSCHAASAYFTSPFDEAVVFTLDARGDFCSGMMSVGSDQGIKIVSRISHLDSIGQFYASITRFLGFRPNRHEGKVTGLAAFGRSEPLASSFRSLMQLGNGSASVPAIRRWLPGVANPAHETGMSLLDGSATGLKKKILIAANSPENVPYAVASELFQIWLGEVCKGFNSEDIAAAAQRVTEEWTTEWILRNLPEGEHPVCLAGGLFANVKVNQRIRELPRVKGVYVQPAMGDSGLSLGAALLAWCEMSTGHKRNRFSTMVSAFLGPQYDNEQIEKVLRSHTGQVSWEPVEDIERKIAELVHQGYVVGRFNGRLEWGPRALGNRSILVRSTDASINQTLNQRLRRTEFMPFAPSVLDYRAKDYFLGYEDNHIAAEFMTITYQACPERIGEIEAVVHVDGTARPQVVSQENNPSFFKILQEYELLSGLGLMVNTSFNIHEEPIVATPEDALKALEQDAVDVLAIGSYLVYPSNG